MTDYEPFIPSLPPAEKLDKLPVWARTLILEQSARLTEWKAYAMAARLNTEPDQTNVLLYPNSRVPVGLPNGVAVAFKLDQDVKYPAYIEVRHLSSDPSVLEISSRGGDGLMFSPVVSNVMRVEVRNRG